ncbi:MAG: hypothetical protein WBD07_10475 [Vicinamibacterales bacterium]
MRPLRLALFIHFVVGAIMLIAWMPSLTELLVFRIAGSPIIPPFFDWSRFFHFPEKRVDLVEFVAVSSALFLYSAVWAWTLTRPGTSKWTEPVARQRVVAVLWRLAGSWAIQIIGLIVAQRVLDDAPAATVAFGIGWVCAMAAPIIPSSAWPCRLGPLLDGLERAAHRWTSVAMLACCLALAAWMFVPLLTQNVRLLNDQITAPEQTLLSTGPVNNLDYIRDHAIYGLHIGSSTTKPQETAQQRATYEIPVQMTPLLREWLEEHRAAQYDPARGHLTVFGGVEDVKTFQSLQAALASDQEIQSVRNLYVLLNQERRYSKEEDEFIDRNWLELRWQMLNRWAVHHHNFVFGPMNELDLGKQPSSISFQYGYVNSIALTGLTKLLGGFTLENYFRAIWLFYPVYIVLLLVIGQALLRDRRYTALVGLLAVASMLALDYEKIIRAPGLSPLRHFLDVPVVGLAAWYWRSKYRLALAGAYALCVLEIALNREFGVILFGALIGVEILQTCQTGVRARRFELACGGVALLAALAALTSIESIPNYMAKYYAAGFASPPLPAVEVTVPMLLFTGLYGMSLWPSQIDARARTCVLLLTMYSNGLYLYYVWGASAPHFQNLAPVFALLGVAALQAALSHPTLRFAETRLLTVAQLVVVVVIVVPAGLHYRDVKEDFDNVFKTHVVHEWSFPRAHVESTIDPRPLEEAVSLIEQFEPLSRGVYFISVFDNLLPMLANRYSAMPFFDLSWFLLTQDEFALAKQRILEDRPRHLYVDHDILYDHSGEVADWRLRNDAEATHVESVIRIRRLQVLQELFRQVSGDYVKVAESPLIDVYQRRPL